MFTQQNRSSIGDIIGILKFNVCLYVELGQSIFQTRALGKGSYL